MSIECRCVQFLRSSGAQCVWQNKSPQSKPQRGDMFIANTVKLTKAPAGRHVYGIGLRHDKSRKKLLLAANHAYNCPDVTSQFSNKAW